MARAHADGLRGGRRTSGPRRENGRPPAEQSGAGGPRSRAASATEKGGPRWEPPLDARYRSGSEVHVATGRGVGLLLLGLLGDDGLGGEEQPGDRRGVLQRRPGHLGRVDDARLEHVDVLTGRRVEAVARRKAAHLLDHDAALETGVDGDLLERLLQGLADDGGTGRLVAAQLQLVEGLGTGLEQGHATTGDDALLDRGLGVPDRVLDAVLALLELDLGRGTGLDDRDTAGQLGETLLQLLAVVVGVGPLDLGADLVDPAGDRLGVTGTVDDRGLVLGDDDLAGAAEQVEGGVLELEADLLGDDLAAGEDGDVLEHRLAAV